jgi:hypothetical protein
VAQDESIELAARKNAHHQARRHFLLALSGPRPALVRPSLVAIGGVIASGKSTVAEGAATQISPLTEGSLFSSWNAA